MGLALFMTVSTSVFAEDAGSGSPVPHSINGTGNGGLTTGSSQDPVASSTSEDNGSGAPSLQGESSDNPDSSSSSSAMNWEEWLRALFGGSQ